jgi:hypothetical protein
METIWEESAESKLLTTGKSDSSREKPVRTFKLHFEISNPAFRLGMTQDRVHSDFQSRIRLKYD